jgi:hypothetical protein
MAQIGRGLVRTCGFLVMDVTVARSPVATFLHVEDRGRSRERLVRRICTAFVAEKMHSKEDVFALFVQDFVSKAFSGRIRFQTAILPVLAASSKRREQDAASGTRPWNIPLLRLPTSVIHILPTLRSKIDRSASQKDI